MTKRLVAMQIRIQKAVEARGDAGQGTLEYIGAIMVAAILVGMVTLAVKGVDLGTKIQDAVDGIFDAAE